MQNQIGKELLGKYFDGNATEYERLIVDQWYAQRLFSKISDPTDQDYERIKFEIWSSLQNLDHASKNSGPIWRYSSIAAAIVLMMLTLLIVYKFPQKSIQKQEISQAISPGTNGATLRLANGKQIKLSDLANGELFKHSGVLISKNSSGQIVYQTHNASSYQDNFQPEIHTLSTDRGQTYSVVLPDQSKVWLNAASSLAFPANFGKSGPRVVELRGEGYFEISKNKGRAFIVNTSGQRVEVLGTHFNVAAYDDDPVVRTTLIEGAVKVSTENVTKLLTPGQQSLTNGGEVSVEKIDVSTETAWREGYFIFNGQSLEAIMKTISRWYNVDVKYDFKPSEVLQFEGRVSRSRSLEAVLNMLKRTGEVKINFVVKGREVIISK